MCGIVGYIGKNIKIKKVIEKLKLLEYRGYDSAGVFALNNQKELNLKLLNEGNKERDKIEIKILNYKKQLNIKLFNK